MRGASLLRSSESSLLRPRRKSMKALKRLSSHSHGVSNPSYFLPSFSHVSPLAISRHALSIRRPMLPTHLLPRHRTLLRLTNLLPTKPLAAAHRFLHRKPSLCSQTPLFFIYYAPCDVSCSCDMLISESLTSFTLGTTCVRSTRWTCGWCLGPCDTLCILLPDTHDRSLLTSVRGLALYCHVQVRTSVTGTVSEIGSFTKYRRVTVRHWHYMYFTSHNKMS